MAEDWDTPPAEAGFELDGGGVSKSELGGSGLTVDREGWYHLEIEKVTPELNTLTDRGDPCWPQILFTHNVLATTKDGSPVGSKHFQRFKVGPKGGTNEYPAWARNQLFKYGLGLGLLKEVEIDGQPAIVDAITGSKKIGLATFQRAVQRQCIAKIVKNYNKQTERTNYEIPFGNVYDVNDPAVATAPRDVEAIKMYNAINNAGKSSGGGEAAGGTKSAQPSQPPKTSPPATKGGVDLSDM